MTTPPPDRRPLRTAAAAVTRRAGIIDSLLLALVGYCAFALLRQNAVEGLVGLLPALANGVATLRAAFWVANRGEPLVTPVAFPRDKNGRRLVAEQLPSRRDREQGCRCGHDRPRDAPLTPARAERAPAPATRVRVDPTPRPRRTQVSGRHAAPADRTGHTGDVFGTAYFPPVVDPGSDCGGHSNHHDTGATGGAYTDSGSSGGYTDTGGGFSDSGSCGT